MNGKWTSKTPPTSVGVAYPQTYKNIDIFNFVGWQPVWSVLNSKLDIRQKLNTLRGLTSPVCHPCSGSGFESTLWTLMDPSSKNIVVEFMENHVEHMKNIDLKSKHTLDILMFYH